MWQIIPFQQTLELPGGGNTFTGINWSDNGQKVWTTDTKSYLRSAKLQSNGLFAWADEILLPSKFLPNGQYSPQNEILEKSSRSVKSRQHPGGQTNKLVTIRSIGTIGAF